MIKFEDLRAQWDADCKIENDLLDVESIKTPMIHNKYLKYLSDLKLLKFKKEQEFKVLIKEKHLYYSGKADPETYKEKPLPILILKQDLSMYIEADPEYQMMAARIKTYDEMIIFLEKILAMLNNRGYQIKNAIEWQKFTQGLN